MSYPGSMSPRSVHFCPVQAMTDWLGRRGQSKPLSSLERKHEDRRGCFPPQVGRKEGAGEDLKEDTLSSMAARVLQRRERNSGSLSLGLSSGT